MSPGGGRGGGVLAGGKAEEQTRAGVNAQEVKGLVTTCMHTCDHASISKPHIGATRARAIAFAHSRDATPAAKLIDPMSDADESQHEFVNSGHVHRSHVKAVFYIYTLFVRAKG